MINTLVITPPVRMWPYVSARTAGGIVRTCMYIHLVSVIFVKGHLHCSSGEGVLKCSRGEKCLIIFVKALATKSLCLQLGPLPKHRLCLVKLKDDIISLLFKL